MYPGFGVMPEKIGDNTAGRFIDDKGASKGLYTVLLTPVFLFFLAAYSPSTGALIFDTTASSACLGTSPSILLGICQG